MWQKEIPYLLLLMVSLVTTVYKLHKSYSISRPGDSFKFSQEWKKHVISFIHTVSLYDLSSEKSHDAPKKKKKIRKWTSRALFILKSRNMIQCVQCWWILYSQAFVIIHFLLKVVTLLVLFQITIKIFLFLCNFSLPGRLVSFLSVIFESFLNLLECL